MKSKFAVVEGQRREAERGLAGICQVCASPMIAKCGEQRVHHWAHKGVLRCDHWWEPETEWHRNGKNNFPVDWQEIVHRAENGEKHIADVKTDKGHVVEFQHSYLTPEERRSREAFYGLMDWVVNGLRRKRDQPKFYESVRALQPYEPLSQGVLRYKMPSDDCALLRDWAESTKDVFIDFGPTDEDVDRFGGPVFWHLHAKSPAGWSILTPVPSAWFFSARRNGGALNAMRLTEAYLKQVEARLRWMQTAQVRQPSGFALYSARQHQRRRHFRF
jgi:competence protein CoiA